MIVESVDGIPPEDDIDLSVPKPVYTVVEASQLPADFLEPTPENRLVVAFDCEGVELSRYGPLCLMQVSYSDMPSYLLWFIFNLSF